MRLIPSRWFCAAELVRSSTMQILLFGGNRFFGRALARLLVEAGHDLTLLNRSGSGDAASLGARHLRCDRQDAAALREALGPAQSWDVVFDQVCFEATDARAVSAPLAGRVGHYVFTSSQAVYASGAAIQEEVFDPLTHPFTQDVRTKDNYAEAKRQCEAVFFGQSGFPITAVRLPIVAGVNDHTGRLHWHLQRVQGGEPIYFPRLEARLSLIHADDAAEVLRFLVGTGPVGALNAAAAEPLRLASLVDTVEAVADREAKLITTASEDAHSPYGIEQDWFMNVGKLGALGMHPRPISEWLQPTLKQMIA